MTGKPKDISGASSGAIQKYVTTYCEVLRENREFMSSLATAFPSTTEPSKSGVVDVTLEDIRGFLNSAPSHGLDEKTLPVLLQYFHEWTKQRLLKVENLKIVVKHDKKSPKFFFWLVDSERAMFELLHPTDDALAFTTHDTNLIDLLSDIWDRAIK